jgi:hypothetical protein
MRQTDVFAASQLEVRQAAIDGIPIHINYVYCPG